MEVEIGFGGEVWGGGDGTPGNKKMFMIFFQGEIYGCFQKEGYHKMDGL